MIKNILMVGALIGAFSLCFSSIGAQADVLTFEDIERHGSTLHWGDLDDTHGGFDFSEDWRWFDRVGSSAHNGCVIDNTALVGHAELSPNFTMQMSDNSAFIWNGAYFGSARSGVQNLRIQGSLNGVFAGGMLITSLPHQNNSWYGTGWEVDTLVFTPGDQFTMDNFTFTPNNNSGPAPVPEPATMLLFGTGMVGMAAIRRFKNKK